MTTREKKLAYIVGGVIGVLGLGFVAYSFVIGPLFEKEKLITAKKNEVDLLELDLLEIQAKKKKFENMREQSLPADVGVSRTEYATLLASLFRRADFAPGAFGITMSDPDSKSAPTIAPKKPAYTKLSYEVKMKGQLYHLVDFMQLFYKQPLLHAIKKINIQRPSDARARERRELDVTMSIEAIVLDNAYARPTVLPIVREIALLIGPEAHLAYNLTAGSGGHGSPLPPAGVLADQPREYLSVAGKNVFFGPEPKGPRTPEWKPSDDISEFIVLTSIVDRKDGSIVATFRDKLNNQNHTIIQNAKGEIGKETAFEVRGVKKTFFEPGPLLTYGDEVDGNERTWKVRRITLSDVIVEQYDGSGKAEKPKASSLTMFGGAAGAFLALPEGRIYRVGGGQSLAETKKKESKDNPLDGIMAIGKDGGGRKGPNKKDNLTVPAEDGGQLGLSKPLDKVEAWKAIYAAPPSQTTSVESSGR